MNQKLCFPISTFLVESADFLWQPGNLGEYEQLSLWKLMSTHSLSSDITSQEYQFIPTSETIMPAQENLICYRWEFPVQAQAMQERELDYLTQNHLSGEKDLEYYSKLDPVSVLSNSLKELSDADFELFLADSLWQDTLSRLSLSRQQSLEQDTRDSDCLSFPTLTSNECSTSRPAGQNKCEKWFKDNGLVPPGYQLSASAIAMMMGFPVNWFSPLSPPTPQEELEVDISQEELLHHHRQPLPFKESSISQKLLGVKSGLKQRVSVERCDLKWAQQLVTKHHYLHRPIHPRSLPFAYSISLDDEIVGTIIMATPHFTKKKSLFGYDGLPTKWQVLQIARLWIEPKYQVKQSNGHASNLASCAIAKVLKRVNDDWLEHHPPKYLDQPYKIELIISYADTNAGHQGIIYQAANFQRWGETTNNRPRHGLSRGSKEPKILYIYRLKQKSKSSIKNSKVLLGGNKNSPLQEDRKLSLLSLEISIPCIIKQPKQPEVKGVIQKDLGDCFLVDLGDETISISKLLVYPDFPQSVSQGYNIGQIDNNPRKNIPPSKNSPRKNRRRKGEGNGSIHYRTVTKNGKEYIDAYYHYVENGKKKTKYIPKTLLDRVQKAESLKLPVTSILFLLGGDERETRRTCVGLCNRAVKKNPRKTSSTFDEKLNDSCVEQDNLNPKKQSPPSTRRRKQGYGAGYIECKPIKRGGKEYKQYWYHYEEWREGDRITKKSKYIPNNLRAQIEKMNNDKVPVEEILKVLSNRSKRKK